MRGRHRGVVLWLTGLPGAGKTTLANGTVRALARRGLHAVALDSDALRQVMTPEPEYTEAERDRVYATLGWMAVQVAAAGGMAVVSGTAPRRRYRDRVREQVGHFIEVHLICDGEELRRRDPKGLYAAARRGQVTTLPGAGAVYEAPLTAEIELNTAAHAPGDCVDRILRTLDQRSLAG